MLTNSGSVVTQFKVIFQDPMLYNQDPIIQLILE